MDQTLKRTVLLATYSPYGRFLLANHPGIWLHAPDCTMHTHHSFLEEIASETK